MTKPGKMVNEVLKTLFQKPATVRYPYEKITLPERFRGRIRFSANKCIGCKMCMRDCPSSAITITKVGDKQFQAEFDLDKCIYCAQCVDTCPKKALEITGEFELAQLNRSKLKVVFHAEPRQPEPERPKAEGPAVAEGVAEKKPV